MTYQSRIFPARLDELDNVKAFVLTNVEELAPMKIVFQLDMIIEEIFVNISSYSYPEGDGTAEVGFYIEESTIFIRFADSGVPFDPLEKPESVAPSSIEDAKVGGLGILMVKKKTDSMCYKREKGQNILTLSKKLA